MLTYADVELPAGRLVDRLRAEQAALFGLAARRLTGAARVPCQSNRPQRLSGTQRRGGDVRSVATAARR